MKVDLTLWGHLLPLLDQVLALPVEQREPWVRAMKDVEPAAREALLQLLAERQPLLDEGFLDALPAVTTVTAPGNPAARAAAMPWHAGRQVGAYRLLREIGRGGMSVVWLAERDDGQLRRQVALKFPHAGPDQAALTQRLRRERDILAALEHRNIARLYDVGADADGVPFLVLEFIEGRSLLEHCDEQRLTVEQRLPLFIQVLRAVQHAHGVLVLHRDIKPSNILVNAEGDVKLLDFGIAKLLAAPSADATVLTRHGARVLTPDYASPEQIAGTAVGTASDVYALGVLLFELLTGERPYRLPRHGLAALEEAILTQPPRRPSEVCSESSRHALYASTPRKWHHALHGDLDLIVLTALHKQPERRYATADAFEQDIRRCLARQPVLARPDSRAYRLRRFVARNALAVGAAGAVVCALGAGLGLTLWQARQTRLEAAKATAVKDFLVGLFESNSVEQADSLRKRRQTVQELLEEGAKSLQAGLATQPEIRDEMQGVVGRLLQDLSLTERAVELRRRRVELQAAQGVAVPQRVAALLELADSLGQQGMRDAASAAIGQALGLCGSGPAELPCLAARVADGVQAVREQRLEQAAGLEPALAQLQRVAPRSAETADALAALGELRARQNRPDEAHALFERASAQRAALWGKDSTRLARSRYELAMNLWSDRRHALAEAQLRSAMQGYSTTLGAQHPTTALVELQLGRLRSWVYGSGQREIAHAVGIMAAHAAQLDPERVFEAQLAQLESLLLDGRIGEASRLAEQLASQPADWSPDMVNAYDLVRVSHRQATGRFDEARDILRALRQRQAGELGESHPDVADIDFRLANIDLSQDRYAQARAGFERVLQSQGSREAVFGSIKHRALTSLARLEMETGRFEAALPVIQANFEHSQRTPREEQYALAVNDLHDRMGQVLAGVGRLDEAKLQFQNVLAALEQGYANNPLLAVVRAHYAACLLRSGETGQARAQLQLADAALRAEPMAGPQYRKTVDKVKATLEARNS